MEREPLLPSESAYGQIEDGRRAIALTVSELLAQNPGMVEDYIRRRGATKLGEFEVEDAVILACLDGANMLTLGHSDALVDYETMWRKELQKSKNKVSGDSWTRSITVEAYVVAIKGAANPDKLGILQPLLKRWQMGAVKQDIFMDTALQAVTNFKWHRFARRLLLVELFIFLTWLVSFTSFALLFQDEDTSLSLSELWDSGSWGRITVALELMALAAMLPFLYIELATLTAYGIGWINMWNTLDMLTYVTQVAITVLHLGRIHLNEDWLSVAMALQCILLWFRLQYFSRVFKSTRFSFLDSLLIVVRESRWYFLFILMVMFGFACAFCLLFRKDQGKGLEEFANIAASMFTMFNYALGGADLSVMDRSHNKAAALALSIGYQFIMCMVLMNLLTGTIVNSITKAQEDEEVKQLLSKVQVLDELEATLPEWIEKCNPQWYPPFVHFLYIAPDDLDQLPFDQAQEQNLKLMDANGSGNGEAVAGAGADVAALSAQIQELQQQVAALTQLVTQQQQQQLQQQQSGKRR